MDKVLFTGSSYKQHHQFWARLLGEYRQRFRFGGGGKDAPAERSGTGRLSFGLDPAVAGTIRQLVNGREMGVFVCLLTGLGILLKKYSREPYVVIASPGAKMGGDASFPQDIPLCLAIDEDSSLGEQLQRAKEMVKQCYTYQNYPLVMADEAAGGGAPTCTSSTTRFMT